MVYILIFTLMAYKGGLHTSAIEFNSLEACQVAAREVAKQSASTSGNSSDWHIKNPILICVPKGKP